MNMLENPMVHPQYHYSTIGIPVVYASTCCDVCGVYEATVQFRRTKLCDKCAEEEEIRLL